MTSWDGITLSTDGNRVEGLIIQALSLTGSVPGGLSALTGLKTISLEENELTGSIPDLSALTNLQTLNLHLNELTGSIPDLSALTNLQTLNLRSNELTGSIPDLSALTNLQTLNLRSNELTGSIPDLSALTNLQTLDLRSNELTGSIPDLSALTNLQTLNLHSNELTGSIPNLSSNTNLTAVVLGRNGLGGMIDASHFPASLGFLYLYGNGLTGAIPDLSALTNLQLLWLHANELTGTIPSSLGNLTSLTSLHLNRNGFTGGIPSQLGSLTGLRSLSLCETDLDESETLPSALETRRTAGTLSVWSCVRIEDAEAAEGETLNFDVTHSTWPVRGGDSLELSYETMDGTASTADYTGTSAGTVTIPAIGTAQTSASAAIEVAAASDGILEGVETFSVTVDVPLNSTAIVVRAATGTIRNVGGSPPGDDDDGLGGGGGDADHAPATCTLVAPYWSGPTGGFTVRPAPGQASVSVTCGRRTTEYSAENGLVTRLVRGRCPGGLRLEGAAPGGWYWQHGERNAAAAPFVCSDALGGPRAVAPAGVAADATDDATWFRHDTPRLVGIVPHLKGNECSEYVSPYWQGDGGVVVRPAEGRSTVKVSVRCGGTWSTLTASPGDDGVMAELVRKDYCTDAEGNPRQGKLTVTGAAPGGWYWISGERNAAVAPLMCADLLGGPSAVDPGGVFSRATEDGTYFSHETDRLIGVVPHVAPDRDE